MKLLVLSDLHSEGAIIRKIFRRTKDDEIATIVFGGDLTNFGDAIQFKAILNELAKKDVPLLFVPGNCDPVEITNMQFNNDSINIHGSCKKLKCLTFLGIGGSPRGPFHTPFEMSENEVHKILEEAYRDLKLQNKFVLLSHTPPVNSKVDRTSSGIHAGSQAVREFIETKRPALVICGHIHEAKGTDIIDGILVVNPGPAFMGLYAIIDIGTDIKVKLDRVY